MRYFFEPWIGNNYEKGFIGVRTLVVGVCHTCIYPCEFHQQCSSAEGVGEHDTDCPYYAKFEDKDYYRLRNSNDIEITSFIDGDGAYPAYKLFTYYMLKCAGDLTSEKKRELWDYVAFTNFLQFYHRDPDMLPSAPSLYAEAYPAFCEMMKRVNPEVVYVWNDEIKECLKAHKEDFVYLGKANLTFGVSLYIFMPHVSQLKGLRLDRLRYRLGIQSENHRLGWYRKLLKKHLEKSIYDTESNKGKIINHLAQRLMDLVGDGILGATENNLYFKDNDQHRWTSQLKGFFLVSVHHAYPAFGRGFNPGMEAIFGERLSTNRRAPNESAGSEGKIARAIRRAFASHPENKPLKNTD